MFGADDEAEAAEELEKAAEGDAKGATRLRWDADFVAVALEASRLAEEEAEERRRMLIAVIEQPGTTSEGTRRGRVG